MIISVSKSNITDFQCNLPPDANKSTNASDVITECCFTSVLITYLKRINYPKKPPDME